MNVKKEKREKNTKKKISVLDASADVLTSSRLISFKMAPWAVAKIREKENI